MAGPDHDYESQLLVIQGEYCLDVSHACMINYFAYCSSAACRRGEKYRDFLGNINILGARYFRCSVTLQKTILAIGPLSRALLKDLGHRIKESTGEARAHEYLVQRLAVAVQRGNAVSIMGTMGDPGQDFFG